MNGSFLQRKWLLPLLIGASYFIEFSTGYLFSSSAQIGKHRTFPLRTRHAAAAGFTGNVLFSTPNCNHQVSGSSTSNVEMQQSQSIVTECNKHKHNNKRNQEEFISPGKVSISSITSSINTQFQSIINSISPSVPVNLSSALELQVQNATSKSSFDTTRHVDDNNLNGIRPIDPFIGSLISWIGAAGLWYATTHFTEFYMNHPIESDTIVNHNHAYMFVRFSQAIRTILVGICALASGFCACTGMGLFVLGIQVFYGVVITGELDPTLVQVQEQQMANRMKKKKNKMPNPWDLMFDRRPRRRDKRRTI